MGKIKAVLFDLDGTLVDSLGDIAHALNTSLVQLNQPAMGVDDVRPLVGWGLRKLFQSALAGASLTPKDFEAGFETLMNAYRKHPVERTVVYPGILAVLKALPLETRFGVVTNKEDPIAKLVVQKLFPGVPFCLVWGSREGRPQKPSPALVQNILEEWGLAPSECVFVGDSEVDMETALAAGCFPLGVTWGFRSAQELTSAGAGHLCSQASELSLWFTKNLT